MIGKFRSLAKPVAFRVLGSKPFLATRIQRLAERSAITILNFHRIGSENQGSIYRPLRPELFEALLDFVQENFDLRTFDTVAMPQKQKPRMILSFDDGYRDFVTEAMPRLRQRDIRVNLNIVPECIESGLPPFNVLLQEYAETKPRRSVERLPLEDVAINWAQPIGPQLSNHTKYLRHRERVELENKLLPLIRSDTTFQPSAMMTRTDVIAASATHEIGAHSFAHDSMGVEENSFLIRDLDRCKAYFRDKLKLPLHIFAFPNGSYRNEQIAVVRDFGIDKILLVGEDFSGDGPVFNRLTFDAASAAEVRFRAVGKMNPIPL